MTNRRDFLKQLVIAGASLYIVPHAHGNEFIVYTPGVMKFNIVKRPNSFKVDGDYRVSTESKEIEKLRIECYKVLDTSSKHFQITTEKSQIPKNAKAVSVDEFNSLLK